MMRNYEARDPQGEVVHASSSLIDCIQECPEGGAVYADNARLDFVTGKEVPEWRWGQAVPDVEIMSDPVTFFSQTPEPAPEVQPEPEAETETEETQPEISRLTEMEQVRVSVAAQVLAGTIIPAVADPSKLLASVRTAIQAADLLILGVTDSKLSEAPLAAQPESPGALTKEVKGRRTVYRRG